MKNSNFLFLTLFTVIGLAVIYLVDDVLLPFIISFILAYLLAPVALQLEKHLHIPRTYGSAIIIILLICTIVVLWLILIPIILEQIQLFIGQIPSYKKYISDNIVPSIAKYIAAIEPSYLEKVENQLNNAFSNLFQYAMSSINDIWRSGVAFINILSMLILVPFITFHLIKDWKKIRPHSKHLVPTTLQHQFQILINRINRAISGFIRGQINVCLILATYYSISLSIANVNYSMFLGIATGILSFVPFIGFITGLIASLLVTYFQFFTAKSLLITATIFAGGSLIENFLSPKLIGDKIGLHPVWIILALLEGIKLFGIVGMFLAIPCAAILNAIIKFIFEIYYHSDLYLGKKESE